MYIKKRQRLVGDTRMDVEGQLPQHCIIFSIENYYYIYILFYISGLSMVPSRRGPAPLIT